MPDTGWGTNDKPLMAGDAGGWGANDVAVDHPVHNPGFLEKVKNFISKDPEERAKQPVFPIPGFEDDSPVTQFFNDPFSGLNQAAHGMTQLATPGERMQGATNVIRGAVQAARAPAAVAMTPAAVAAPIPTAVGLGAGALGAMGGGAVARGVTEALGGGEDAQDLAGTVGEIGGGLAAGIPAAIGARMGGKAAASGLANSALGTTARNRGFGRNPGQAALAETTGLLPETVQESAATRSKAITNAKEAWINQAGPVDLAPARQLLSDKLALATKRGDLPLANEIKGMQATLSGNQVTGTPYGQTVPAAQALDILRGFGNQHPNFVEGRTDLGNDTAKSAWATLRNSIRDVAPNTEDMDQRITNLLEVEKQAGNAKNNASMMETGANRLVRPTGGLAPAMAATFAGGPGAGLATLAGQEALGQPAAKMGLARALYRGVGGERMGVPGMPAQVTPAGLLTAGAPASIVTPPPSQFGPVSGMPSPIVSGAAPYAGSIPLTNNPIGQPSQLPLNRQLAAPAPGMPPVNVLPTGPGAIGPAGTVPMRSAENPIPMRGEFGGRMADVLKSAPRESQGPNYGQMPKQVLPQDIRSVAKKPGLAVVNGKYIDEETGQPFVYNGEEQTVLTRARGGFIGGRPYGPPRQITPQTLGQR